MAVVITVLPVIVLPLPEDQFIEVVQVLIESLQTVLLLEGLVAIIEIVMPPLLLHLE